MKHFTHCVTETQFSYEVLLSSFKVPRPTEPYIETNLRNFKEPSYFYNVIYSMIVLEQNSFFHSWLGDAEDPFRVYGMNSYVAYYRLQFRVNLIIP